MSCFFQGVGIPALFFVKRVTAQTGLYSKCTDLMKEQILSPMGQGTLPARGEAILIGWMHARSSEGI